MLNNPPGPLGMNSHQNKGKREDNSNRRFDRHPPGPFCQTRSNEKSSDWWIDYPTRKLASISYGEASGENNPLEIAAIAWAVANRARAWGQKSIDELLTADPNYTYVIQDGNPRFKRLMRASEREIASDPGMSIAVREAKNALTNKGTDPSNGAFWWDGLDFKTNFKNHPKVKDGFHITDPSQNIFNVKEVHQNRTVYWKIQDPKTNKEINAKVRGTYSHIWETTAAYGKTIFWKHGSDYLKATGSKPYK